MLLTALLNMYFAASYGWFALTCTMLVTFINLFLTSKLMKPIIPLSYAANKREGDLRFAHARIREFAESVVFYGGQDQECHNVDERFSVLYSTLKAKLWASLPTYMYSMLCNQLMGMIVYAFVTIEYMCLGGFKGATAAATFGNFMAANTYISTTAGNFSGVAQFISRFSDVAGLAHRIAHVSETLRNVLHSYQYFEKR